MKRPRTIPVLLGLIKKIEQDPQSKETEENSLFLYNEKARKKLKKLREEIVFLQAQERKEEGREVPVSGYSGLKTNRR